MNPFKISLRNILEEAIETFVIKSDEKNIQIQKNAEIDSTFDFRGDTVRITQVLFNILSIDIKFTPQNGTIAVQSKILSSTEEESIIQISIEDSGIGIEQFGFQLTTLENVVIAFNLFKNEHFD